MFSSQHTSYSSIRPNYLGFYLKWLACDVEIGVVLTLHGLWWQGHSFPRRCHGLSLPHSCPETAIELGCAVKQKWNKLGYKLTGDHSLLWERGVSHNNAVKHILRCFELTCGRRAQRKRSGQEMLIVLFLSVLLALYHRKGMLSYNRLHSLPVTGSF